MKAKKILMTMFTALSIALLALGNPDNAKAKETATTDLRINSVRVLEEPTTVETTTNIEETTLEQPSGQEPTSEEPTTEEPTEPPKEQVNILFVGNSHTHYNDMPYMLRGMIEADDKVANVKFIAQNGYKLAQYANPENEFGAQVYAALQNEKWDYVILQENRERLIENPSSGRKSIDILYPMIKAAGAKMMIYATQGNEVGAYFKINNNSVFFTANQMLTTMTKVNYDYANSFDGLIANSGTNFERMMRFYPDIKMYKSDELHPSVAGSFLAACTIYANMFDKTPIGNAYLPGSEFESSLLINSLSLERATLIQKIADARIKFEKNYIEVQKNDLKTMTAEIVADENNDTLDGFKNDIQWYSVDQDALNIDRYTGQYVALQSGVHLVKAESDNGLVAYASVKVLVDAVSLTIDNPTITKVTKGEKGEFTFVLLPADTTDTVDWISSNVAAVTVDNGKFVAKGVGIAKITATTTNGIKASRYVRVILKTPTKVKVKKISSNKKKGTANLKVSWKKIVGASKYQIYRQTGGTGSFKKIGTSKTTNFTDKKRKRGVVYSYKVVAVHSNSKLNSSQSEAKSYLVK